MTAGAIVYPLSIYYDASCPLCREEMHALKEYDGHKRLVLIDCSRPDFSDFDVRQAGFEQRALMQRIHARDAAGQWLDGVAVFEAAYRAAEIESVARLWGHPKLQPLLDPIYMWVARHRMQLSRLGLNKVYGYLVRRAAQRAARRSRTCADKTGCALDNTAS